MAQLVFICLKLYAYLVKAKKVFVFLFLLIAFVIFAIGVLKNSSWVITNDGDSVVEITTGFPNADCTKKLMRHFPFFEFHCSKDKMLKPAAETVEKVDTENKEDNAISSP